MFPTLFLDMCQLFPSNFEKRLGLPSSFLDSFMGYLAMHPFFLVGPPGFPPLFPGETSTLQEMVSDHRAKHGVSVCTWDKHMRDGSFVKILLYGVLVSLELFASALAHHDSCVFWKVLDIHWYLSIYKDKIINTLYVCMRSFNMGNRHCLRFFHKHI